MRASASKAALLVECQHWARSGAEWYDPVGQSAQDGTAVHKLIEDDILSGSEATQASSYVSRMATGSAKVLVEQAFGLDPATSDATVLSVEGRNYPEDLLCGTADVVIVYDDKVLVLDWKSGRPKYSHNEQCKLLASMAAVALGKGRAEFAAVYVGFAGEIRFEPVIHTVDDPVAVLTKYAAIASTIELSTPWPGYHCGELYCPHAAYCKEGDDMAERATKGDLKVTEDNAREVLELVALVEKRCARARDELKKIARKDGGIVVGGGRVWGPRKRSSRRMRASVAEEYALRAGATEDDLYYQSEYEVFEATKGEKK